MITMTTESRRAPQGSGRPATQKLLTRDTLVTVRTTGGGQWSGVVLRDTGLLTLVRVTGAPEAVAHVVGQTREVPRSWVSVRTDLFTAIDPREVTS